MHSRRRVATTAFLLAVETAALAMLVRLGERPPFDLGLPVDRSALDTWRGATPEAALSTVLRWVAVVAVAWLVFVTVVCALAALTERDACTIEHRNRRGAIHALRRLVDHAVLTGVIAGVIAAPGPASAGAATRTGTGTGSPTPIVTIVRDGRSGPLDALPSNPTPPNTTPPDSTPADTTPPVPAPFPVPVATAPHTAVVGLGDSLWELAAARAGDGRGVSIGTNSATPTSRATGSSCATPTGHRSRRAT